MPQPIKIDLSGLASQFGLSAKQIDDLTAMCVAAIEAEVYDRWSTLAKERLYSTLPAYMKGLTRVDKSKVQKQIILEGKLPNMIEQGASPFDMKVGFKNSPKARYTIPKYRKNGTQISKGGSWYLNVPFRQGTPGIVGQAGFANEMPQEVYKLIKNKAAGDRITKDELMSPYDQRRTRARIAATENSPEYAEYVHKHSIYEGITKVRGQYDKTAQNTYMSWRRASENSDPMAWIHKGLEARKLADEAVEGTDVDGIVQNMVMDFLENVLR